MVIISAAICDKLGKILLSRQFQNISKMTLEEYILNFPKSISSSQQHTFVEAHNIRYVYLPLESLYLLLITNKSSNIIEDLETVRILQKIVIDLCPFELTEANVVKNAFQIILAFDDVISFGYRESITVQQVQNALEMESSEEKLAIMLRKARENEAKEAAVKHLREVAAQEKSSSKMVGMGSSVSKPTGGGSIVDTFEESKPFSSVQNEVVSSQSSYTSSSIQASKPQNISNAPKKGLQLGKKIGPQKTSQQQQLAKNLDEEQKQQQQQQQSHKQQEQLLSDGGDQQKKDQKPYNPLQAPVEIEFVEKLSCSMSKDGTLNKFEIIGEVFVQIQDDTKRQISIQIQHENHKSFLFKPHPNLNRNAWKDAAQICTKDQNEGFPARVQIPTLKYKFNSSDVKDVPFTFTHWFNNGTLTLEVEFNQDQKRFLTLQNIQFNISYIGQKSQPTISSIENSEYQLEDNEKILVWNIPTLNADSESSSIEVKFAPNTDVKDFFPLKVNFTTEQNFYNFKPTVVKYLVDQSSLNYGYKQKFTTEDFSIE